MPYTDNFTECDANIYYLHCCKANTPPWNVVTLTFQAFWAANTEMLLQTSESSLSMALTVAASHCVPPQLFPHIVALLLLRQNSPSHKASSQAVEALEWFQASMKAIQAHNQTVHVQCHIEERTTDSIHRGKQKKQQAPIASLVIHSTFSLGLREFVSKFSSPHTQFPVENLGLAGDIRS